MMRIVATICQLAAPETCVELVHDFVPRQPIACIFAGGPELDRITPQGWVLEHWHCASSVKDDPRR